MSKYKLHPRDIADELNYIDEKRAELIEKMDRLCRKIYLTKEEYITLSQIPTMIESLNVREKQLI